MWFFSWVSIRRRFETCPRRRRQAPPLRVGVFLPLSSVSPCPQPEGRPARVWVARVGWHVIHWRHPGYHLELSARKSYLASTMNTEHFMREFSSGNPGQAQGHPTEPSETMGLGQGTMQLGAGLVLTDTPISVRGACGKRVWTGGTSLLCHGRSLTPSESNRR